MDQFEIVIVADRVDQSEIEVVLQGNHLNYRIVCSEGPGIVEALNTGLQNITSEYVARMDEDDIMCPNRLELQMDYLDRTSNCVAVGGQLDLIDEYGSSIGESVFRRKIGNSYWQLFTASPVAHPAAMIRRRALTQIGGYRAFLAEDWDLWTRLREIGEVHNLSQKVIKYRIHRNQLSREKMYAQSHARLIVGVSYFARQSKIADEPSNALELDVWLAETIERLRSVSLRFRLFRRWARRINKYQERLNHLMMTKKISSGLVLLIQYPIWFLRDILKKAFN